MTALRSIANGWGYEITSVDVPDAYHALMVAAGVADVDAELVKADVRALIAAGNVAGKFVHKSLARQLAN